MHANLDVLGLLCHDKPFLEVTFSFCLIHYSNTLPVRNIFHSDFLPVKNTYNFFSFQASNINVKKINRGGNTSLELNLTK